jgi:hypothetical protein
MMRTVGADDAQAMANRYGALAGSVTRSSACRRQMSPRSPPGPPTPRAVTVRGRRARMLGSFCAQSIQNAGDFGGAPEPPLCVTCDYFAITNQDAQIRLIWLGDSREHMWRMCVQIAASDSGRGCSALLTAS